MSTGAWMLSRGVYRSSWVGRAGERFLEVILADGRRLLEVTVTPEMDMEIEVERAWNLLDAVDPAGADGRPMLRVL